MERSFAYRRNFIIKNINSNISTILEEYPALIDKAQVI